MTRLRRSPVLIVAALTLLAIGGGTAAAATRTPTAAALVQGEFAGNAGHLAGIGVSTNGRRVIAYLCNGTSRHISLAQWFTGPVTRNRIDITNAHGTHLVATASAYAITGTVTLKDGRSAHFTARLIAHPGAVTGCSAAKKPSRESPIWAAGSSRPRSLSVPGRGRDPRRPPSA